MISSKNDADIDIEASEMKDEKKSANYRVHANYRILYSDDEDEKESSVYARMKTRHAENYEKSKKAAMKTSVKSVKRAKLMMNKTDVMNLNDEAFKIDFKRQHVKLAEVIKNLTSITSILKKILNITIEKLSVEDLLRMFSRLHKFFFFFLSEETKLNDTIKVIETRVQSHRIVNASEFQSVSMDSDNVMYVIEVLQVEACVFDRNIQAMIDTDSQINVMSEALMKKLNLKMRIQSNCVMIVQTRDIVFCLECCEDVSVTIDDVTIHSSFLVVSQGDRDFILERS
jgi:hypothetical protein